MTASEEEDQRVTEFSLAVLEGTGWYTPDYSMADPMFWGKGKGCDFLQKTCMSSSTTARFDEFCSNIDTDGCSYSGKSQGFCGTAMKTTNSSMPSAFNYFGDWREMIDDYADNCPYYHTYTDGSCLLPQNSNETHIAGEKYGNNSMCFTGTIRKESASTSSRMYCFEQTVNNPFLLFSKNLSVSSLAKEYIVSLFKLETLVFPVIQKVQ